MTPLHWSISGILIGLCVPLLLLIDNKTFGISSSLSDVWDRNKRRKGRWKFKFLLGVLIGAALTNLWSDPSASLLVSSKVINRLKDWNIDFSQGYYPIGLFNFDNWSAVLLSLSGGFLVGYGARLANGCTSGHCISGISNLQLSSMIVTLSFFIGAIITSYLIYPMMFTNYQLFTASIY